MEKKFPNFKKLTLLVWFVLGMGQAFAAWNGVDMTPAIKGDDGYYIIDSEAKLAWFANESNKESQATYSENARLTADLDMGGKLWTPICAGRGGDYKKGSKVVWTYPIYGGTFDGNGHSVSNIYISAEELIVTHKLDDQNDSNYAQNLGFIGSFKGTVKNLNLVNIEVHGYGKGGLGDNKNLVDKPISIGTVVGWQSTSGSLIDGCTASGVVVTSGDGQGVGGIVGNIGGGKITNCMSTVSIKASGLAFVGGIAGYTKNYQNGSITVSSCVYAGTELSAEGSAVVGGKTYNSTAGAIVGHQYNGTVTLSNLYYDEDLFNDGIGATTGGSTNGEPTGVPDVNAEGVICALNGAQIVDGECPKDSPWSVGESSVSLNGSDGYTITFNAKSGAFPDGAKKKKVILKDRIITPEEISAPIHTDSAFAGWSLDPIATEPDADLGSVSGTATVYAVWYPIYTITFSATPGTFADGKTVIKTVRVAKGDTISVTGMEVPTCYVRNDSTLYFTGWSDTQKEFKADDDITASDTLHLDDFTANGDRTFYAAWTKAETYTVTYNANGHGKTKIDFVNVKKGEKLTAPPSPSPDKGYKYLGWCLDALVCDVNTHFDFGTTINRNYTLYADWARVEYAITYNLNGGTNSADNPATYTIEDATIVFKTPVRTGYTFKGWFYDENFEEVAKQITHGSTEDKFLYAKWEETIYEVAYMAGSDATGSISPVIKKYGKSVTLAEEGHYTREGYSQDGWSIEDGGEKVYALGATYSKNADITLYPHWVEGNVEIAHYGAVTIYSYGTNHVEAVINGDYEGPDAVNIPVADNVVVNQVTFNRDFSGGVKSTVMFPFTVSLDDVSGGVFREFDKMEYVSGVWKFRIKEPENNELKANKPYIFVADQDSKNISFNLKGKSILLSTEDMDPSVINGWVFGGTYEKITFNKNHSQWAYAYGYVGEEGKGLPFGRFIRFKTSGKSSFELWPMRAYLVYDKSLVLAKSAIDSHSDFGELPDIVDVEIVGEKGFVIGGGVLNTKTGEFTMDRWYDLRGRRLNGKPTTQGTYYYNGKRVIVR